MKSFRTSMSISLVALVATLVGCGVEAGGADTETAQSAVSADTAEVAAKSAAGDRGPRGHRGPGGGGPDFLVQAALREDLGLSDAQKTTLEGLLPKREDRAARPLPDKTRDAAFAAAIRSGNVAALPAMTPPAKDEAAHAARQAEAAKALDTLHATLTAEQRAKLVAALANHEGPKGHGKRPDGPPREDGKEMYGPMGGLLAGITLTDAQKEQLKAKLDATRPAKPTDAQRAEFEKKMETMRAERQAKLQTFASDSFDATAFVTPPARPEGDAKPQEHHAAELAAVISVLDATQREQLATKIEQGPHAMRPAR